MFSCFAYFTITVSQWLFCELVCEAFISFLIIRLTDNNLAQTKPATTRSRLTTCIHYLCLYSHYTPMATKTCNQTFYTLTASLHCLLKKLLAVVCYAAVSFLWFSRVLFSLSICFFMNCCAILHDIIVFFRSIFVLVLLHCLFHAFVVIVYYIIKWKKN